MSDWKEVEWKIWIREGVKKGYWEVKSKKGVRFLLRELGEKEEFWGDKKNREVDEMFGE